MISGTLFSVCIAASVCMAPCKVAAEYALDVVEVYDRACIPFFAEDRSPAESGLRNLTTEERVSTIYEGDAFDEVVWVDPIREGILFLIIFDEGCSVSGWVRGPAAAMAEVEILADRLDASLKRTTFDEVSVVRERGNAIATYCVHLQETSRTARLSATIGRDDERWGTVLRMLKDPSCEPSKARESS